VAGPVGAVEAATGTVGGVLGADLRPRFRTYVGARHPPSHRYHEDLRVGAVLPESGVTYYEVPDEYRVTKYKYTIVNDQPVLVDPTTRTIVEVID
jgi:hypothetical protein